MAELHSASPALGDRDFGSLVLAPHVLAPPCGMSPSLAFTLAVLLLTQKALQAFLTSELALGSFCAYLLQKSCLSRPFFWLWPP